MSELFAGSSVAETPTIENLSLSTVENNEFNTIDFDFSFAEDGNVVITEEYAQTADLNAYNEDLLNYICVDRLVSCNFTTVTTADKWDIKLVRVSKSGDSTTKINSQKQLYLLAGVNSDCTYWAHHQLMYDLINSGFSVWLGNTRFSKGFAISANPKGTINNVATHDIPKSLSHILTTSG